MDGNLSQKDYGREVDGKRRCQEKNKWKQSNVEKHEPRKEEGTYFSLDRK
jgi:hypothetical protein